MRMGSPSVMPASETPAGKAVQSELPAAEALGADGQRPGDLPV